MNARTSHRVMTWARETPVSPDRVTARMFGDALRSLADTLPTPTTRKK